MTKLKGPFKIEKGKPLPKEVTDVVKETGIVTPFDPTTFKYSNTKLDDWFRVKKNGKKYKYNRMTKKFKEDKSVGKEA